ncbi:MAG: polysaccharide pyruvyl transferase family protein [Clostridia bacterium]|nr:polysaccharide pyruvyl transferase family protein [Clostridia bacterium]
MKEVRVVTYCTWYSLGSIMQSIGLRRALAELDCHSVIWFQDDWFTSTDVRSLNSLVRRCYEIMIGAKRKSGYRKRMAFIGRNLDMDYYSDAAELESKAAADEAEIFLAGSDQIWHPDLCRPTFFLDFASGKKRVSYAASMGKTEISPEKLERFTELIRNFDTVSVREQECADVIGALVDRDVEVHIDPTFLLPADEWRQYETPYRIRKPYILVYMLYWNKSCKEKIKQLKKKTGLPVYAIADSLTSVYADKMLHDVGPEEFLWLIDHAEYVVTSSFHGVALSTILNKKFAAVVNPSASSRIVNLMRTLSVPLVAIEDLADAPDFDYATINEAIRKEKERSMQYLKKVLE